MTEKELLRYASDVIQRTCGGIVHASPSPSANDVNRMTLEAAQVIIRAARRSACPHCHGTGYIETREPESRVTSYAPCAYQKEG